MALSLRYTALERANNQLFVQSSRNLDWDQYPLTLTASEAATVNFERVRPVMEGRNFSPSALANLDPQALSPTMERINAMYRTAILDYTNKFALAVNQDINKVRELLQQVPEERALSSRMIDASDGFFLIYLIAGPVALFELLFGYGGTGGEMTEEQVRDASAARKAWINHVDALEEKRIRDVIGILMSRMRTLLGTLTQLHTEGEIDVRDRQELSNLTRVYIRLNDGQDPVVDGRNIADFLEGLQ